MITMKGEHNEANVMIDDIDESTKTQIQTFLNSPALAKTYVAIMPDCHAGNGVVVGYTAKMNDLIIPNLIGVDIGCGVLAIKIGNKEIDYEKLDRFIKHNIPNGFSIRSESDRHLVDGLKMAEEYLIDDIMATAGATKQLNESKIIGSLGTLGGGNHFIEIDKSDDSYWLLIHSGSRNFGLRVATYYQEKAKILTEAMMVPVTKGLEYMPVWYPFAQDYLTALGVAQKYASLNRKIMANVLINYLQAETLETIESIHNYINFDDNIIRKGAISAHEGERLVIPFNMRDGVAVCTGKGNKKWNFSSPHGAGRIMSRTAAKKSLSLDEYKETMKGVYTTTANIETLDEAPMAYKDFNTIVNAIEETVSVDFVMHPVYNFKAGSENEERRKNKRKGM